MNKPFDGLELVTRLRAAALLMNATKATSRHSRLMPVAARDKSASTLHFSDGFSLDPEPGLVTQAELVCEFMETDQNRRCVHLFSVAISDAEHLWGAVSAIEFRTFVNQLAKSIARITQTWEPRISYIGDGVFVVALLDAGFLSTKGIHTVFRSSLETMAFEALARYRGEIALCVEHVRLSDPDDFLRVDALFKAGVIAKSNAAHRTRGKGEKEIRHQLMEGGEDRPFTSYKFPLMKTAPEKIMPRRVSRQRKAIPETSESSASKRIPKLQKDHGNWSGR